MSLLFQVDIEPDLIFEFREELETAFQEIEGCVILLEKNPSDLSPLQTARTHMHNMWVSSTKLSLVPLSESLDDTIKAFDHLIECRQFPPRMGEYLLLLADRILYIAREIERNLSIDIRETQNILVSLQHVLLSNCEQLPQIVDNAIEVITKTIEINIEEPDASLSIDLFDDEDDMVAQEPQSSSSVSDLSQSAEIFIADASKNPMLYAQDLIQSLQTDDAIKILARISDHATSLNEDSHTRFILELSFAINFLAGEPIDHEALSKGLFLHDVALSAIPHIINKTDKLTNEERLAIQEHPQQGAKLALALSLPEEAINIVAHHHERVDGKGYPAGLHGNQISEAGKLAAIVDSFHAMIDNRPHKKYARSPLRAVAEINACVDSYYDKLWIKYFNIYMKDYWLTYYKNQNN